MNLLQRIGERLQSFAHRLRRQRAPGSSPQLRPQDLPTVQDGLVNGDEETRKRFEEIIHARKMKGEGRFMSLAEPGKTPLHFECGQCRETYKVTSIPTKAYRQAQNRWDSLVQRMYRKHTAEECPALEEAV